MKEDYKMKHVYVSQVILKIVKGAFNALHLVINV